MSEENVQITKAAKVFEWNLNTLVGLTTLVGLILGIGFIWNDTQRDIKEVRGLHVALEASVARVSTHAGQLDDRLDQTEAMTVRLSDRISAAEARSAEFSAALRDLQTTINEQSAALLVATEILRRVEAGVKAMPEE